MSGKDFTRGYYCAVANLVRMHGATVEASDLVRGGGDINEADDQDKATLAEHGLIYDATGDSSHG